MFIGVILQGAFQFLKLYGYPDIVATMCNKTVGYNIIDLCIHLNNLKTLATAKIDNPISFSVVKGSELLLTNFSWYFLWKICYLTEQKDFQIKIKRKIHKIYAFYLN